MSNRASRTEKKLREEISHLKSQIEQRDASTSRPVLSAKLVEALKRGDNLASKLDEANKTMESQREANVELLDQIKMLEAAAVSIVSEPEDPAIVSETAIADPG